MKIHFVHENPFAVKSQISKKGIQKDCLYDFEKKKVQSNLSKVSMHQLNV